MGNFSNLDTIIAVPTIALVDNKINQYPNERYKGSIFGVKGGISDKDIEKYIYQQRVLKMPIKIMVTYDSLYNPSLTGKIIFHKFSGCFV